MLRLTVLTDGAAPEATNSSKFEISGSRDLAVCCFLRNKELLGNFTSMKTQKRVMKSSPMLRITVLTDGVALGVAKLDIESKLYSIPS